MTVPVRSDPSLAGHLRSKPRDSRPQIDVLASDVHGRLDVASPIVTREDERVAGAASSLKPRRSRPAGWEIGAAIAGWPLWWATGFNQFVFIALGILLVRRLSQLPSVRLPKGFLLWALFLLLVLLSGLALNVAAPATATSEGSGRFFAFALRAFNYLAVTVIMLYIGNTSEEDLPRSRLIKYMAILALSTIVLGALAVFLPHAGFPTPASFILPSSALGNDGGTARLAQVQAALGDTTPRPSAPFAYTNFWGNNLSLLLVWLVAVAVVSSKRRRIWLLGAAGLSIVPIIYSLNRGVWLGILVGVLILGGRLAKLGRIATLAALVGAVCVSAVLIAFTPLQSILTHRAETPNSNNVRTSLAGAAISAAQSSPILGYGSTRETQGSDASIAIGPTPTCSQCGYRNIGSTGQLWLVLVAQGFLGAFLYFGFLVRSIFSYWKDVSIVGLGGTLVVVLEIFYSFFYDALTMPLAITFLSIGLLWRNQQLRQEAQHALPVLPPRATQLGGS